MGDKAAENCTGVPDENDDTNKACDTGDVVPNGNVNITELGLTDSTEELPAWFTDSVIGMDTGDAVPAVGVRVRVA